MLKRRPGAEVWGIEPDVDASLEAASRASRVVHGMFPQDLPANAPLFDAIVFGDVLEHVYDPWSVLRSCRSLLSQGGVVIASIPNVRYWMVLNKLLFSASFAYTDTGVLDRTHIRFFTRSGMLELFSSAGFDVVSCEPHSVTEYWKARVVSRLPKMGSDIRTKQYILVGRTTEAASD